VDAVDDRVEARLRSPLHDLAELPEAHGRALVAREPDLGDVGVEVIGEREQHAQILGGQDGLELREQLLDVLQALHEGLEELPDLPLAEIVQTLQARALIGLEEVQVVRRLREHPGGSRPHVLAAADHRVDVPQRLGEDLARALERLGAEIGVPAGLHAPQHVVDAEQRDDDADQLRQEILDEVQVEKQRFDHGAHRHRR